MELSAQVPSLQQLYGAGSDNGLENAVLIPAILMRSNHRGTKKRRTAALFPAFGRRTRSIPIARHFIFGQRPKIKWSG